MCHSRRAGQQHRGEAAEGITSQPREGCCSPRTRPSQHGLVASEVHLSLLTESWMHRPSFLVVNLPSVYKTYLDTKLSKMSLTLANVNL